jgi:cytochrome c oxidase subunit 2
MKRDYDKYFLDSEIKQGLHDQEIEKIVQSEIERIEQSEIKEGLHDQEIEKIVQSEIENSVFVDSTMQEVYNKIKECLAFNRDNNKRLLDSQNFPANLTENETLIKEIKEGLHDLEIEKRIEFEIEVGDFELRRVLSEDQYIEYLERAANEAATQVVLLTIPRLGPEEQQGILDVADFAHNIHHGLLEPSNTYPIKLTALDWQIDFQASSSTAIDAIIAFHDDIIFYIIFITIFVLYILLQTIYLFSQYQNQYFFFNGDKTTISNFYNNLTHNVILEVIWTVIPTFLLCNIIYSSFSLLYALEEIHNPQLTVKVLGHQWYWSYEIDHILNQDNKSHIYHIDFDSYIIADDDLEIGQLRLLETDRALLIPSYTEIRLVFSGADVIHSWAVPTFGIKTDCIPGRLNQTPLYINKDYVYAYGQCSELCGINHGFIPINVNAHIHFSDILSDIRDIYINRPVVEVTVDFSVVPE